jgi:Na+/H+-dicarboxylate symporter/ABC-type amino acid transport substrate-binding protein
MTETTVPGETRKPTRRKLDISTLILIGMGLGIVAGIFFGELATAVKFIGDAFIKLLQMTILPYVVVTIIAGFGTLSAASAKKMAINGGLFLLIFWAIGIASVVLMAQAYPPLTSATFFSASQITAAQEQNLVDVFVPANFFESLAEGTVPAVVVFSILFGVVLINVEKKDTFLGMMETVQAAFENISEFVFKLSPIGIFALTASAAGTLKVDELSRLQAHFATYIVGTSLLILFVLPYIVSRLVGFRYGEILSSIRSALILAFTSGNAFITLPLMERAVKQLYADRPEAEKHVSESNVVVPVVYNFPTIGTLFHLLFILFTAWLYSKSLGLGEYFQLNIVGLLNLFGGSYVTIPYLLDMFKLPSDAFELFLLARIITDMFENALDVMSIFTLTLLYMGLASGLLKRDTRTLVTTAAVSLGVMVLAVVVLRLLLSFTVATESSEREILQQMSIAEPVAHEVMREKRAPDGGRVGEDLAAEIKARGVVRVGYNPNSMPFAFFNQRDELVGYDIALAHELARGLGVRLELYPFEYATLVDDLKTGAIDIAMSSISINFERMRELDFSVPYMKLHLAFVVPDHKRKQFQTKGEIERVRPLKIAVIRGSSYIPYLKAYLPDAEIVEFDERRDFFEGKIDAHALLTTAEQGSAWTLLYPSYGVVIPEESIGDDFIAYPIDKGNFPFLHYVDTWLTMAKLSDRADRDYNYWILGKDPKLEKPRWSIIRDVLHWVD